MGVKYPLQQTWKQSQTNTLISTKKKTPKMGSIDAPFELKTFPDGTPMDIVFDALYRNGAVRIKNLVSPEGIAGIQADLQPHFDTEYNSQLSIFAKETKTICGIAGNQRNDSVSPPLLSGFFAVRVGPGSGRQGLHRDDQDQNATHTHGDPRETTKMGVFTASKSFPCICCLVSHV